MKKGSKSKAELLIKEGGGVPWEKNGKVSCVDVSMFLETWMSNESLVKKPSFKKIKDHINNCSNCKERRHLLSSKRNNIDY